jgi:hypothetical protein
MKQEKELQNKRLIYSDKMFVILEKNLALPRRKLPFLWTRVQGRKLL